VQNVIAIEMLCASQGIDFHKPYKCGKGTSVAHKLIREHVSHLDEDRILYDDIQTLLRLVKENTILKSVENSIGELL